ncbi:MAG TPA: VTT domain-containing protein [Gemmatimonadales bacterium]
MTDLVALLESLPPGPLYALITALAAVENIFPPVPADTAVALGAFLAGRGVMNPWLVFLLTWSANVGSGAAVYGLARRHGRELFRGVLGQRLFSDAVVARIEEQYRRHGVFAIFVSRLLPVWRGVVMPFAGIARVPAARAIVPLALASGVYYGVLTLFVTTLGTNVEQILRVMHGLNVVLGIVAAAVAVGIALLVVRRLKH